MNSTTFTAEDLAAYDSEVGAGNTNEPKATEAQVTTPTTFTAEDLAEYDNEVVTTPEPAVKDEGSATDYIAKTSKFVSPAYAGAMNKINTVFSTNPDMGTAEGIKLSRKEKAAILNRPESEFELTDDKALDGMVAYQRARDTAAIFPNYVNRADTKALSQMFTNPSVVKQLNNSAKARAMKATSLEKFARTNTASVYSMLNTFQFITSSGGFDEWAMRHQVINAEREANAITTAGTKKLNVMWDSSEYSLADIAGYVTTDVEGFKSLMAEVSNSAASIASSIGGGLAGGLIGVGAGPAGVLAGTGLGTGIAGAIAHMDAYVQNELDRYKFDGTNVINWIAVKKDIGQLTTKIKLEAAEHGLMGGAIEALVPKFLAKLGGKLAGAAATKLPAKMLKPATAVAMSKIGKFSGKVINKGTSEFVGEMSGDTIPTTLIDFQNGRLTTNKLLQNINTGVRGGVAGLVTAGAMAPGTIAIEKATAKVASTMKARKDANTPPPVPPSASKPFNEQTPEEQADFKYKTDKAEDTMELVASIDEDTDTITRVEGMTDAEKINMLDSANTESFKTEDGTEIEGTPTEVRVHGSDLNTLLGPDVSEIKSVLSDERKVELTKAIESGEEFRFTYGEWVVGASKLKAKHPDINQVVINNDTEMSGYEAASHLSEVADKLEAQYESLQTPDLESSPPPVPGISAEIAADTNPAAISARKQTGVVKAVTPTGNINKVTLELVDGSTHTIDLYDKESTHDIQSIADKLSTQFSKALKASGRTSETVHQASLQGIPVIMRVLVKRAKALGKPISEMAKSISFKSDASSGSAYIGVYDGDDVIMSEQAAFHGSPHNFDEFSTDKIGSGEGAQAFGYGLYFTEDRDIAEYYRKGISVQKSLENENIPLEVEKELNRLDNLGFDSIEQAILAIKKSGRGRWKKTWDAADASPVIEDYIFDAKGLGQTFEVELAAEKEHMLDWDGKLKDQSNEIQAAIKSAFEEAISAPDIADRLPGWKNFYPFGEDSAEWDRVLEGNGAYNFLSRLLAGKDKGGWNADSNSNDKAASHLLKKHGVPGIKYKAEQGKSDAHNFVVFDDKKVKVVKKLYASGGSSYIGTNFADPSKVVYGVGRTAQRVSTVAHEFGHAILHFMTVDGPELEAQKQAGTISPEGLEYLSTIEATAKLLGLKDISQVDDNAATTLTNPKTGKMQARNQSRQILTKRTVIHEKLATTMEVFLKAGHLKTEAMETDIARILLYWRSLIPSEVLSRQASVAAQEGWTYSGEYHQALDPSEEVGDVFHAMYAVNQQIDKTVSPMFNFSFFPAEMLGKGGKLILDKVIASKHLAIAKVFAKVYADSINARTEINKPESIAQMNKELSEAFGATNAGALVTSLSMLGLKIPESMSKDLRNIQDLMQRHTPEQVPFFRDATEADIEALLSENTDAVDAGDSIQTVIGRMVNTFTTTKVDIYQKTLEDLGYVTDDKVKQAAEDMLAKALPGILNDQFSELVKRFPDEAKKLFAAYVRNGKVSSRTVNKMVAAEARKQLNDMTHKDLKIGKFIKAPVDTSLQVVNAFNQGKFIEALAHKYTEITQAEILRQAPELIKKVERAVKRIGTYEGLDYQNANRGKVHPETLEYLRGVLNNLAAGKPLPNMTIAKLDPMLNAFTDTLTRDLVNDIAGKKMGSVEVLLAMGDYADMIAKVSVAAMTLENEAREFMQSKRIAKDKQHFLKSKKVWNLKTILPQAMTPREVFSSTYKNDEDFRNSGISDQIYDVKEGEANATIESEEAVKRIREYAKPSLSKKFEPITTSRTKFTINTREDLISILAYIGSESGRDTFMRTHGLVTVDPNTGTIIAQDVDFQADLDDMAAQGVIDKADIDFVNKLFAEFVPLLKDIKEVYRRDKGIAVGEIKAEPYLVGGMQVTGGYFPISYEEVYTNSPDGNGRTESLFYKVFGVKNFNRTKARGEAKDAPVRLGLGTVTSYVNMVHREKHISQPLRLFEAFVNDPDVKAHLELIRPGALGPVKQVSNTHYVHTGIIGDWISSVRDQVGNHSDPNASKFVNWILRNTSLVFYSMDLLAGVTNTAAGIPAAIPYVTSNTRLALNVMQIPYNAVKYNNIAKKSALMRSNEAEFVKFVSAENSDKLYSKWTTTKEFMDKAAMTAQKVSQRVLETTIWVTEYQTQIAKGNTEAGAVKQADVVTEQAVGSYAVSHMSLGQKGGTLSRFTNIASMHLFKFQRHIGVEMHRDSELWRRTYMSAIVVAGALASSTIALSLQDFVTADKLDETKEAKEERMRLQVMTEMIPYYTGPWGRILSTAINMGKNADLSISPVEHSIKKTLKGAYMMGLASQTNYEMGFRDYANVFGALTMVTGVPLSGITNAYEVVNALGDHRELGIEMLSEDAERRAYSQQFGMQDFNPLID